ncbi:MAG: CDP-alcohol phosphatidyltransferase family protein [Deltaproteobacteria bacterium]|nr:MAG: CDP-alcohol phosphatidyltransferase family protein [Deltaproteobacteria bacterium]
MDHAIIVAYGNGIDGVELGSFPTQKLVGVPQLNRLIIVAQRAGITNFTILTDSNNYEAVDNIENDKRINSKVNWHCSGDKIELESKPYLVLQSNLLITPDSINTFINEKIAKNDFRILVDNTNDPYLTLNSGRIEGGFTNSGKAIGVFISNGKDLKKAINSHVSLDNYVSDKLSSDSFKVKYKEIKDSYWYHLTESTESFKKAEDILFSNVGKTATGWISRTINSKFSLPTSRLLVKTPLTPNMISILINIIGVFSGVFLALKQPVMGCFFLYLATILDRCDGEVARVKLMETKTGQWVDTISDQFTMLSFFIGLTIGYYRVSDSGLVIVFGLFNLFVFFFFLSWSFYYLVNYTNSGSLVSYFTVDKYVDNEQRSLIRKIILFLRPMSRRNYYAMGFLVVSIIGGYPWLFGSLTFAMLLFCIHLIQDIIKIRKYSNKSA